MDSIANKRNPQIVEQVGAEGVAPPDGMVLLAHIIVAATASFRQTRQWWRIVLGMIFNRSVAKELIVLADPVVDANVALVTIRNRDRVPHEVSLEEAGAGTLGRG